MRARLVGLVGVGLLCLAVAGPPGAAGQEGRAARSPSVDGAVQVTANPGAARAHAVPAVAVDPRDERVVVVAEADTFSGRCTVHVSTNAGLSWTPAVVPQIPAEWPNCTFVNFGPIVDLAFAPDGTLYYAVSGYNPTTRKGRVFLARSSDLGSTWDVTMLPWIAPDLERGEVGIDAVPSVAIDPDDPQKVYVGWGSNWATYAIPVGFLEGKLYYWDVIERVYVAASTDGGRTFSEPVDVGAGLRLTPEKEGVKPPPQVLVGNEGEVYAYFGEYSRAGTRDDRTGVAPPAHVYQAVSTDGGRTYTNGAIYTGPPPTKNADWTWVPRAGIDRDTGTIYVAWEDMSSADDPVRIVVMRSEDGGRTWSEPVKVNDVEPGRQWNYPEAYPNIAVAPGGRVDVAWYDWRNDPAWVPGATRNTYQDVYYTFSEDGGRTWAPNVRVTDRVTDRRLGPWAIGSVRGTLGLASLEGGAYVAWDDTRNGSELTQSQDIYFARVHLDGRDRLFGPSSAGGGSAWAWGLAGAALGLAVGGVALLFATAASRRRTEAVPAGR